MKQMAGGCCICWGEKGSAENPLVICHGEGCNVTVHKVCYGIVNIPYSAWFCRKCEFQGDDDKACKLCPRKDGALKRTEHGGWAHVVCALYTPEIKFANNSTLEPIILKWVPLERYINSCCICESQGQGSKAKFGSCIDCRKPGCNHHFHVTCGQAEGLLCEERETSDCDAYYYGYCPSHHSQLEKESNRNSISALPAVAEVTEPSDDSVVEVSSSAPAENLEHLSAAVSSHGSQKKKRKKRGRKPIKSVGICRGWTYSTQPVMVDTIVEGRGAFNPAEREIDPFTNVLTGVGLIPIQVVGKPDVEQACTVNENTDGLKPSGFMENVVHADSPELSVAMEESTSSWKEPSRSETPASLSPYDSESTLSNTSDFGSNIKYSLDYVFSQMSTENSANQLEVEPEPTPEPKITPRRSKTSKASDAPSSSSDSTNQHSSKWRKKEARGMTYSSFLVSPPVTPTSGTDQEMSESMSRELVVYNPFALASSPTTTSSDGGDPFPRTNVNSSMATFPSSAALDPHHLADHLERLWDQGDQVLMEEGQQYDVPSLSACLDTIRQDNAKLQDNVTGLTQRRDRLLAANASSNPLTVQTVIQAPPMTNIDNNTLDDGTRDRDLIRLENTELKDRINSLLKKRNDLLDVNAVLSIPLNVQPVTQAPSMAKRGKKTQKQTTKTSPTSGSSTGNSVNASLDELIRNMSLLLSLSSPEMVGNLDMPTREQQLAVLHRPTLHPVSSSAMPSQHGLNGGREMSKGRQDQPLDLSKKPR